MTTSLRNNGSVLETSPLLSLVIVLMLAIAMARVAVQVPHLGAAEVIVDFDAFYIVGLMIHEGRLTDAYQAERMFAAQRQFSGTDSFMPWTYPPQFDLLVATLPHASRGLSYVIFTALTLGAYLLVLRRIAGRYLTAVLIALLPILLLNTLIGQNGFLTGALVGGFCLALRARRGSAGLPLGLMVIKPHLGVALGVLCLMRGQWSVLLIAALVALVSAGLATLAFGPEVWPAFVAGVRDAGGFLQEGLYPLFRMTSLYAALHTMGVPPQLALSLQAGMAILVLAVVAWTARRKSLRQALAVACFASVAVSPYTYDYDMAIFGVGLALIVGDIVARCSALQKTALIGLAWLVGGWGLVNVRLWDAGDPSQHAEEIVALVSIGGPAYLALLGLGTMFLARAPAPQSRLSPA